MSPREKRGAVRARLAWSSARRLGSGLALAALIGALAVASPAAAQQPATDVSNQTAYEVASQLRCVVCQNLSVADSPSEMAQQMRVIVRERLAAGDRPEQVLQYFVDRYGEWILLAPRRRGFNLLIYLFPVVAVVVGLVIVGVLVRRWTRRSTTRPTAPAVDRAMSERIRREMERGA
jgi:cytochrome c-type biogenesis protein CcmH